MDCNKEDIEKYHQNICSMVKKLKSPTILRNIRKYVSDISEEEEMVLKYEKYLYLKEA